jgi:RimJ/RimL family protein N-acetyltransferase
MIETPRLVLRPFALDDLDAFASMNADAEVMRYIGAGKPQSREQTGARLLAFIEHQKEHGFGLWAAVDKASGDVAGFCGLQFLDHTPEVEVGYRLAKRFWGMGLASEAARTSLRYGFEELGLDRIVAVVRPENAASQRVVEKIGLRYVRDARFYNTDVRYYAITRDEYERDESTYVHGAAKG